MPTKKTLAEHEIKFLLTAKNTTKSAFGAVKSALPSIKTLALSAGAAITALGAATALGVKESVRQFADFEEALVDVARVTDRSLEEVRAEIMALPPELGSATDLVRGYYNVISAGVTKPKAALDLLTTAAKASQAGHLDLKETVAGLTNIMDGLGGAFKDATEASDKLFTIERLGKVEFQELIPVIGQVASSANLLNVSVDELGGLFATVSKTAGSTEASATQVKAIFASLLKPTTEMSKALSEMGFSSGALAIKQLGLKNTFEKLNEKIKEGSFSFTELFSKQRALLGIGAALQDNLKGLQSNIEGMATSAGATNKAFEKWTGTLKGIWATFKNTVGKIAIEIGAEIAPDIKKAITDIGGYLRDNPDEIVLWVKNFIAGTKELLAELEPFKDAVIATFIFLKDNVPPVVNVILESLNDFRKGLFGIAEEAPKAADKVEASFARMSDAKFEPGPIKPFEGVDPDAPLFKRFGQLLSTIGDALGTGLSDFVGSLEDWKVSFNNWVGEMMTIAVDFIKAFGREFSNFSGIAGIDFGAVFTETAGLKDEFDLVTDAGAKMASALNDIKIEPKIIIDPAKERLKELEASAEALQKSLDGLDFTVSVDDTGVLKITNLKSDLEDPSWDAALIKNFTVDPAQAKSAISSTKEALDGIKPEKTVILTADITDITAKSKELKNIVTTAADEFIKANEKLLKPFRDAAGNLPKELMTALELGKKVLLSQSGFIITETAAAMESAAMVEMPKVGKGMMVSLDEALRDNANLPEDAIADIMNAMIRLFAEDPAAFKKTGASILESIGGGMVSEAPKMERMFGDILQTSIDDQLPHSPAVKGPLTRLDEVGPSIINTIADGIISEAETLSQAMSSALTEVVDAIEQLTLSASQLPPIDIKTNAGDILSDIEKIPLAIQKIPNESVKSITIPTEPVFESILKIKEAYGSIPDNTVKMIDVENVQALDSIAETVVALINVPDITSVAIEAKNLDALIAITEVITLLESVPNITRTLDIDARPAFAVLDEYEARVAEIPKTIFRTLVLKVETQASPRMPFSEGMTKIEDRISGLSQHQRLVLGTSAPNGTQTAPLQRFNGNGAVSKNITQNIDINVNINAGDMKRSDVPAIVDEIAVGIARKLDTGRATELTAAIKRI